MMRIIDSHTHLCFRKPEKLLEMADRYGYDSLTVLGLACCDLPLDNVECLTVKALAPERAYVYGSMAYPRGFEPTRGTHVKQLEMLMEAGFDGWKLLESKPSEYRNLQLPLDGDLFDGAFALAEETGFPVTWHAGDPATFWDAEKAPKMAVENNWLCVGEGYPELGEIYRQVENVLKRHPKLKATLAHLFFTSDDRRHAERLLDTYEDLRLDITPGVEMYQAFLADREGWIAFFEKYADRLIFGTDMMDDEKEVVFGDQGALNEFINRAMTEKGEFEVRGMGGTGMGLSDEIMRKIYAGNYLKRVIGTPRVINKSGLGRYLDWLHPYLNEAEASREAELKIIFGL